MSVPRAHFRCSRHATKRHPEGYRDTPSERVARPDAASGRSGEPLGRGSSATGMPGLPPSFR